MTRLLFFAHDPGAAQCLWTVSNAAKKNGYEVSYLADGPAFDIWQYEGAHVHHKLSDITSSFDFSISGTGFSNFERDLWPQIKASKTPVLAVIDAWTNFPMRFSDKVVDYNMVDGICVIDDWCQQILGNMAWCQVPVYVTGQPHLQSLSKRIRNARKENSIEPQKIVFFSEPIDSDFGRDNRGYDQFEIARSLISALPNIDLFIKPHPREDVGVWQTFVKKYNNVYVTQETTDELLTTCKAVIGMTTMVLFEAKLSGIKTLSLQMGRLREDNAVLDRHVDYVVDINDLDLALKRCLHDDLDGPNDDDLNQIIDRAEDRFVDVINQVLVSTSG